MHHFEDVAYPTLGAIAPHVGAAIGMIQTAGIVEAIVASAVGAATAWIIKEGLNWIKRKFKGQ